MVDVGFCKGGCISAKHVAEEQPPLQNPTSATVNAVLPGSVLNLLLRPQNACSLGCHHPVIHPLQVNTHHHR